MSGMNRSQKSTTYGAKRKPHINDPGSNKAKAYKALNMRQPAGASILELQQMDRTGEDNYTADMLYSFEDKFTDIELEKFKEAFIFFDRNGDGTMSADDVCLAMRAMGALVTEKEVQNLLKKYDPDRTGTIDVNDFIACMAEVVNKEDNPHEIRNSFSVFDKDENGMLPVEEMRHVLTRIGDPLSQEEITNFLNILDIHGDGYVRMPELMTLLIPQTNKDIYAKTVGGEGVERSQMKEQKSQSGALNLTPQSTQNSGTKRQRKGLRKQNNSDFSQSFQNSEAFAALSAKYKDIPGVFEWVQVKKQELESQKKSLSGLPLQTQWKPPRIDIERYQVDQQNIPDNINSSKININNTFLSIQSIGSPDKKQEEKPQKNANKRKKRSYSSENNMVEFQVPKRQVLFNGQPLLMNNEKDKVEKIQLQEEMKQNEKVNEPQVIYDVQQKEAEENEDKMKDYLELADFIMRETNSHCNGIWLKGSMSGYQEKALQLLHHYDYNYTLAKFHILYPSVMAIPERKEEILSSLTDKEMESIVTDAIIDLRGCKSQEADEAIQNIRTALKHRLTIEDLSYYQQVLKKLRVEMPQDIELEITNSREFSKQIKKKCGPQTGGGAAAQIPNDKKMKMNELLQMQQESMGYCIVTSEMQQLNDYVKKAQQWIERAEQLKNQVVNIKQLQNILQEARSIPVNFEALIEDIKKRCNDSQALIEKIYNSFIKVTKTRTQVNSQIEQGNLKERKKQLEQIKKEKKQKEQQFRDLIKEADVLMINNPEVKQLRDHMNDVDLWKNRVMLFLEDELEQKERKEVFNQLLRETALFKIEVDLVEDLQRRLEFIEWHEKVIKIYNQIFNQGQGNKEVVNADNKDEEKKDEQIQQVYINQLQTIMQEGEAKGFADLPIQEIQKVGEVCIKANQFQQDIKKVLQQIKEGKDLVKLEKLIDLYENARDLMVNMDEISNLQGVIQECKAYEQQCLKFVQECQNISNLCITDSQDQQQEQLQYLKEMLQLRQQVNKLGIKHKTFTQFNKIVRPILHWIKYSRLVIKQYYKSLDLQMNQLNLLEQQDINSESEDSDINEEFKQNDFKNDGDMQIDTDTVHRKQAIEIPNNDYDMLLYLIKIAQDQIKILTFTKDYQVLKEIEKRVISWINKVNDLQNISQDQQQVQIVDTLEKLVNENLPLPSNLQHEVQKQLRREKWLRRLNELYNMEKVKLKQIETLVKDSNHIDIQEDPKCKQDAEVLKQQLNQCKEWLNQQQNSDLNSQKDIGKLIDLGKNIKINLCDYIDLKGFFQDVIDWREKTQKIFQMAEEFNYEAVRKHIEIGVQLDINDKEIDLLRALVEMCAHWKSLSRKILKSRELCKLEKQQIIIPQQPIQSIILSSQENSDEFAIILQKIVQNDTLSYKLQQVKTPYDNVKQNYIKKSQYFDNHQYCICRRGDDGLVFMIECDMCKEWFHGDCIGLSKQIGAKLQHYICIGCARVHYNYEPFSYNKNQEENAEVFEPELLKIFSIEKRTQYQVLKAIIQEGKNLPIYLEEMEELTEINQKIEDWLERIEQYLDISVDAFSQENSSEIITTKTNQQQQMGSQKSSNNNEQDKISSDILKLYLESESFPVEIAEAEDLILILKQRKWYQESMKMINQQYKQNKVQQKKTIKKLILQFNDIKRDNDHKMLQVYRSLHSLNVNNQQHISPSQQQHSQISYSQQSQNPPQTTEVEDQLNALFRNGAAEYGQCISLLEYLENHDIIQSDDDRVRIEDLKTLLTTYSQWLSSVRECVNDGKKPMAVEDFLTYMSDGEKLFWMITSVEKVQYQQILEMQNEWIMQAKNVLAQIHQTGDIYSNPETHKYFIQELGQLMEQYKNIPFQLDIINDIENKYKQLIQIDNQNSQQVLGNDDHLSNPLMINNDNTNDFFK